MILISKTLKPTDIKKMLVVPTDSLPKLGYVDGQVDNFVDFSVKDSTEKVWYFRCSTRLTGNHPKPYLSLGWLKFVKAKQLRPGDHVEFYKEMDAATGIIHIRIKVHRNISLLGQVIRAEV
ncbi:hypothetical protein CRYUN_Cryun10bG0161900 [Craigia yunnanensis]